MSGILCGVCGQWRDEGDVCPYINEPAHLVARLIDERDEAREARNAAEREALRCGRICDEARAERDVLSAEIRVLTDDLRDARENRDRAFRERDAALEQRRIALDAAKVARQYRHDEIIGLRNLIERASPWVAAGGAAEGVDEMIAAQALALHDDMRAALQGVPSETVAELRRRAEQAEKDFAFSEKCARQHFTDLKECESECVDLENKIAELEKKLAIVPLTAAIMAVDDVQADYTMLCKVLERALTFIAGHGVIPDDGRARLIGDVSEVLAYFTEMSTKPPAS